MFVKELIPLFKVYLAYLELIELCPQFDSGFRHHQKFRKPMGWQSCRSEYFFRAGQMQPGCEVGFHQTLCFQ